MGTTADESGVASRAELRRLLGAESGVQLRPMFGTLAALVDGHVFAVALGEVIGVKLDPDSLLELAALGGEPLAMGSRTMRAYRSLPAELSDEEQRGWLARARHHVSRSHSAVSGDSKRSRAG